MLDAGNYQFALGAFANMSFAENFGAGSLSDGFIGLGEPYSIGNASYSVALVTPVPEPATSLLFLLGGSVALLIGRTKSREKQCALKRNEFSPASV